MNVGEKVNPYLSQRLEDGEGLLVRLNTGGCTGYQIEFIKKPLKNITQQSTKVCQKVYVETESQEILSNCTLDINDDPFAEMLTINVPKDKFDMCGCNNSFAPKNPLDY